MCKWIYHKALLGVWSGKEPWKTFILGGVLRPGEVFGHVLTNLLELKWKNFRCSWAWLEMFVKAWPYDFWPFCRDACRISCRSQIQSLWGSCSYLFAHTSFTSYQNFFWVYQTTAGMTTSMKLWLQTRKKFSAARRSGVRASDSWCRGWRLRPWALGGLSRWKLLYLEVTEVQRSFLRRMWTFRTSLRHP